MNPVHSDRPHVAFLGTGLMGEPMAHNLLRAGFPLTVWNRTAAKTEPLVKAGAQPAATAVLAAPPADAVVMMLENADVVDQVLFGQGVAQACRRGSLVIDMSSIRPAAAVEHARRCHGLGLRYIDAPVSGGTVGAREATLAIMAGGIVEDLAAASQIFEAMGRVTHVGPHGGGQLSKLVNQVIVAITIGAVAEGLQLAEAGGADPARVRQAILGGFCQSRILELHGQRMIDGNFKPGGTVRNQIKDLKAALEVSESLALAMPITRKVCEMFEALAENGHAMLDHSALLLQLRHMSGQGSAAGTR